MKINGSDVLLLLIPRMLVGKTITINLSLDFVNSRATFELRALRQECRDSRTWNKQRSICARLLFYLSLKNFNWIHRGCGQNKNMPWNISCFKVHTIQKFHLSHCWQKDEKHTTSQATQTNHLYLLTFTYFTEQWLATSDQMLTLNREPLTHPTSMQKAWKSAPFMSKLCLEDSLASCSTPLLRSPLRSRQYSASRHLTELMLLTYSSCVQRILIYQCRLTCPMQTDLFCSKQAPIRSIILWEIINIHILITLLSPFSSL